MERFVVSFRRSFILKLLSGNISFILFFFYISLVQGIVRHMFLNII